MATSSGVSVGVVVLPSHSLKGIIRSRGLPRERVFPRCCETVFTCLYGNQDHSLAMRIPSAKSGSCNATRLRGVDLLNR